MEKLKILVIDRKIRKYIQDPQIECISRELEKKTKLELKWILIDPELENRDSMELRNFNYQEFEEYQTDNILKILEIEKPDIILIYNDYDYFIRSFIPCAKLKKIPIILYLPLTSPSSYLDHINFEETINKIKLHKKRKNEVFSKFKFMLKNYKFAKTSYIEILKIFMKEVIVILTRYQPLGEYGTDYVLVAGEDWKNHLIQKKVKSSVIVVGTPKMDILYHEIQKLKSIEENRDKIDIVLLTTPLVEHGLWTTENWKETIRQIIKFCINQKQPEVNLVIKIHPTSESKEKYKQILKEMSVDIPIYQRENLLDIINQNNIIMTYGFSSATLEALLLKKPVINVNLFNYPKEKMPFVKANLSYELKSFLKIEKLFLKNKFTINQEKLDEYIMKNYYKFDGKSSERIANQFLLIAQSSRG